jgi:hypothetical protein
MTPSTMNPSWARPLVQEGGDRVTPYTDRQEVTMNLLAITLLGFKFSGTLALGVAVVVVIIIGLVWFVSTRQRRG